MAIHSDCGAEIRWPRKQEDPERFGPPLEYYGQGYIFNEDGTTIEVSVYRTHICDADQMEVWLKNKARIERLRMTDIALAPVPNELYQEARAARYEAEKEKALRYPCETCGVGVGEMCIHKRTGELIRFPHEVRRRTSEVE